MNLHYLHLLLNHFPIIGTAIAIPIMLVGLQQKNHTLQQTSLMMWVLLALLNFAVMQSGEAAEEALEAQPGINEQLLHEHEEAGETAHFLLLALGACSGITLLMKRKGNAAGRLTIATTLVSAIALWAAIQAGKAGGAIRHADVLGTTQEQGRSEGGVNGEETED
ncbi:MAG: hypothetical protein ACKORE_07805 [Bacteroidota bacterium]